MTAKKALRGEFRGPIGDGRERRRADYDVDAVHMYLATEAAPAAASRDQDAAATRIVHRLVPADAGRDDILAALFDDPHPCAPGGGRRQPATT